MTVSIIIPTINRVDQLKQSVGSVLAQDFLDYELIISDNCSSDGTMAWASELATNNRRVRYSRNTSNLGMVGNWNAGIKKARGKYVSILMDDDIWETDFLRKTVNILDAHSTVGLVVVKVNPFKDIVKDNKSIFPKDFYKIYPESCLVHGVDCIVQYLTSSWLVGLPSAILFRRSCFDKLGYFDEIGIDPEMCARICSQYDVYYLDEPLCNWRAYNKASFTKNNNDRLKIVNQKNYVVRKILNYHYSKQDRERIQQINRRSLRRFRIEYLDTIYFDKLFSFKWWREYFNVAGVDTLLFDTVYLIRMKVYFYLRRH